MLPFSKNVIYTCADLNFYRRGGFEVHITVRRRAGAGSEASFWQTYNVNLRNSKFSRGSGSQILPLDPRMQSKARNISLVIACTLFDNRPYLEVTTSPLQLYRKVPGNSTPIIWWLWKIWLSVSIWSICKIIWLSINSVLVYL